MRSVTVVYDILRVRSSAPQVAIGAKMICLRRNRSVVVRTAVYVSLLWCCVILYLISGDQVTSLSDLVDVESRERIIYDDKVVHRDHRSRRARSKNRSDSLTDEYIFSLNVTKLMTGWPRNCTRNCYSASKRRIWLPFSDLQTIPPISIEATSDEL